VTALKRSAAGQTKAYDREMLLAWRWNYCQSKQQKRGTVMIWGMGQYWPGG